MPGTYVYQTHTHERRIRYVSMLQLFYDNSDTIIRDRITDYGQQEKGVDTGVD